MNTPQLAERLGHASDARLLIVNADDFGSQLGTNTSIVEGFRRGAITSTTLMVPCPWAAHAAHDGTDERRPGPCGCAPDAHQRVVRLPLGLDHRANASCMRPTVGLHRDLDAVRRQVLAHGARGSGRSARRVRGADRGRRSAGVST